MAKRHRINYSGYIKDMVMYMSENGLHIKPYPIIKLSNKSQDGVFIRTGYYDPSSKTVVVFVKDRHPKDVLRSVAHELIHHCQNLEGRLVDYSGDKITEDEKLMPLEEEAYKRGNVLFRSWTEDYQKQKKDVPHKTFSKHMKKKISSIDEHRVGIDESLDYILSNLQ